MTTAHGILTGSCLLIGSNVDACNALDTAEDDQPAAMLTARHNRSQTLIPRRLLGCNKSRDQHPQLCMVTFGQHERFDLHLGNGPHHIQPVASVIFAQAAQQIFLLRHLRGKQAKDRAIKASAVVYLHIPCLMLKVCSADAHENALFFFNKCSISV